MATIINIDSSLETASVSIAKDGIILQHLMNDVQKQHASFIHIAVQKLINDLQISLKEVDAIGCTIGPGSYTGLRVGLAAAKGFCYALNIPLITLGTLEAMAHSVQIQNTTKEMYFCPMTDARRMEVYTALYNQHLEEIVSAHAVVLDEHFYEQYLEKNKILFFGNGMQKYKNLANNEHALFENIGHIYNSINILSYKKFTENISAPLASTVPLYAKEFYNGL
jgi:tRNA threonylcarbamoyladenosine biosynthesis protein TsaB